LRPQVLWLLEKVQLPVDVLRDVVLFLWGLAVKLVPGERILSESHQQRLQTFATAQSVTVCEGVVLIE